MDQWARSRFNAMMRLTGIVGWSKAHGPTGKSPYALMIPDHIHLQIGSLLFEGIDQIDVTGPFEVFSRLPNSTYRLFATTTSPLRDMHGLVGISLSR